MSWNGLDDPRSDSAGGMLPWRAGTTEEGVSEEAVKPAAIHVDALHVQDIQALRTKRVTEDGRNRSLMGPNKLQAEAGRGELGDDDNTRLGRTGVLLHLDMPAQEILASPALIQVTHACDRESMSLC